jgi:hypothetical protein
VLLVRRVAGDAAGSWELPGTRLPERARPEETIQRHCAAALGLKLTALAAQPPVELAFGSHGVRYHVFCTVLPPGADEALPLEYAECAWVAPAQLTEYALDALAAALLLPPGA